MVQAGVLVSMHESFMVTLMLPIVVSTIIMTPGLLNKWQYLNGLWSSWMLDSKLPATMEQKMFMDW